ncbi:MAG: PolC-type DNA polymerase III [Desulfovibrionales bacterium]
MEPLAERISQIVRRFTGGVPAAPRLQELEHYFRHFDQDRNLDEYEFVVLDTELTGLTPRRDEIVSIGAVKIRNFQITAETFYTLVAPKGEMPKTSTLIHRITPEQVREAPTLRTMLPKLLEFCGTALIVGHNIGLDMQFLNRAAVRIFGSRLKTPCIDTMRLAQVYEAEQWENYYDRYDESVSYQLNDLSVRYGLPAFGQHNSFYDAMQTSYLFLFLVRKLHSGDIKTLRDLYMAGRSWRWYM